MALYQQMIDLNLEGMVAKKRESKYVPGERGNNWVKMPTRKRQKFVIMGWAESDKGRSFKSLLFGAYKNKKIEWIGRSGGGYKDKEMPGILKQLKALEIEDSPFVNKVLDTKGAVMHWVKPQLVANFEFATWTKTGRIRKPAPSWVLGRIRKRAKWCAKCRKQLRRSIRMRRFLMTMNLRHQHLSKKQLKKQQS